MCNSDSLAFYPRGLWGKKVEIFSSCISVITHAQVCMPVYVSLCQSEKNVDIKLYCYSNLCKMESYTMIYTSFKYLPHYKIPGLSFE